MKSFSIIIVATLAVVCANTVLAQDYCNEDLCDPELKHIGCGNSGKFAAACPTNARIVEVAEELILQMVNVRRNRTAGGALTGFPAAVRMPTVVWSYDLQRLAELSLKRCALTTDQCRNTYTFSKVGQLLFYEKKTGGNLNYREHIIKAIQTWFTKYEIANAAKIASYEQATPTYGAFAQLVNQYVTHMGCGSITYKETQNSVQANLLCNFAARNTPGSAVYEAGDVASGCTSGPNPDYVNLCSVEEEVDPNAA